MIEFGKREMNKAKHRLSIMDQCIQELESKELHEVKITDICDKIGISKVTFFSYFSSKEQVIELYV